MIQNLPHFKSTKIKKVPLCLYDKLLSTLNLPIGPTLFGDKLKFILEIPHDLSEFIVKVIGKGLIMLLHFCYSFRHYHILIRDKRSLTILKLLKHYNQLGYLSDLIIDYGDRFEIISSKMSFKKI